MLFDYADVWWDVMWSKAIVITWTLYHHNSRRDKNRHVSPPWSISEPVIILLKLARPLSSVASLCNHDRVFPLMPSSSVSECSVPDPRIYTRPCTQAKACQRTNTCRIHSRWQAGPLPFTLTTSLLLSHTHSCEIQQIGSVIFPGVKRQWVAVLRLHRERDVLCALQDGRKRCSIALHINKPSLSAQFLTTTFKQHTRSAVLLNTSYVHNTADLKANSNTTSSKSRYFIHLMKIRWKDIAAWPLFLSILILRIDKI